MNSKVFINNIATSVPETEMHSIFLNDGMQFLDSEKKVKIFQRLAKKSHIDSRYSVLAGEILDEKSGEKNSALFDFYRKGQFPSTKERMEKYKEHALPLAEKSIVELDRKNELKGITHLITVSCTGFYAPGLDIELIKRFDLAKNIERTSIGFMGCYAAFNAYKQARHIVRSEKNAKVLIVNLELCSLHFQESSDLEQMLAFLIFADGCAATVISNEDRGLELESFDNTLLETGIDKITWHVGDEGFNMHLSLEVPKVIGLEVPKLKSQLFPAEEIKDINLWAIHPGGRSILDTLEDKLSIDSEKMKYSRSVLRNYGNMSSATVPFVLKNILQDPQAFGKGQAMAFGPGMTVESMSFNKRPM